MSNTYIQVIYYAGFLFCFPLPCVHYGASFSGFYIFDNPTFFICYFPTFIYMVLPFLSALHKHELFDTINTVVSNHLHSSKFHYFRPLNHINSMECCALDYRCQYTQQQLQSICAVLSFDIRILITPVVFSNSSI
jgi:hypothetical protein